MPGLYHFADGYELCRVCSVGRSEQVSCGTGFLTLKLYRSVFFVHLRYSHTLNVLLCFCIKDFSFMLLMLLTKCVYNNHGISYHQCFVL
jgi:hypothetical protein